MSPVSALQILHENYPGMKASVLFEKGYIIDFHILGQPEVSLQYGVFNFC